MFNQINTIDMTFRQIKLLCILWFIMCAGASAFIIQRTLGVLDKAEKRIYVLSAGKVLEAFGADRHENLEVEARDHVRTFHQSFFTLDPDEKVINANITRALYLADGSGKRLYDNLKENGYYAGIISGNISQQIVVDSIRLDMASPPYFRCWARLIITRPTSVVTRSLITEGWLRSVSRSDNNPHGFLIEKWSTVENRDLKVEMR